MSSNAYNNQVSEMVNKEELLEEINDLLEGENELVLENVKNLLLYELGVRANALSGEQTFAEVIRGEWIS